MISLPWSIYHSYNYTSTINSRYNTEQYITILNMAPQRRTQKSDQILNSKQTPYSSPSRASYRVCVVSILKKVDRGTTALRHTSPHTVPIMRRRDSWAFPILRPLYVTPALYSVFVRHICDLHTHSCQVDNIVPMTEAFTRRQDVDPDWWNYECTTEMHFVAATPWINLFSFTFTEYSGQTRWITCPPNHWPSVLAGLP